MDRQGHGNAESDGPAPGAGQPDPVAMLERSLAAVGQIVANVRPAQLDLPSPCCEWTVRDVIDHLVKGNAWTVASLSAETGSAGRPTDSMVGDDPAAAFAESSAAVLAAFRAPGARGKMLDLPFGRMPGAAVAGMRSIDLLVHGWDIAKATGQSTDFAPDLNEAALAAARHAMTFDRAGSPFAPEQPVPSDAPAADRLAAFLGRAVENGAAADGTARPSS